MGRRRISIDTDEFGEPEAGEEEFPEHPLFPQENGSTRHPDISFIQVTRRGDGAMVWGPVIPAAELTSTDQIVERWGGGFYELQARKESKRFPGQPGNFATKRSFTLPGQEKPFSDRPTQRERIAAGMEAGVSSSSGSGERAATSPPIAISAGSTGMGDSVLVAILNMQQQAAQQAAAMMLNMMTMFMKMSEDGKAAAQAQQAATMQMISGMSTNQNQSIMTLLPLLIQNRGGGPEEVAKYAQLFKALAPAAPGEKSEPEPGIGNMLESLADIVAGAPAAVSALKGLQPTTAPPMGAGEPAPNGSAASVLMPR